MRPKKLLRLRQWVVTSNCAGRLAAAYFFTEVEARAYVDILKTQIPIALERHPESAAERYYGFADREEYGFEIRLLAAHDALQRYPRIVAHMICHSLGYCTPLFAGHLVLTAAQNGTDYSEWIFSCYQSDPWPALCDAIEQRHHHRGYMADIEQARDLVDVTRRGGPEPAFASWF